MLVDSDFEMPLYIWLWQANKQEHSLWTKEFLSCCPHIEQTEVMWSVTRRHSTKASTSGRANRLDTAVTNMIECESVLQEYWRHTKQSVSFGPEQPPAHSRWQQSLTYGPKHRPSHCSAHTVFVTETETKIRESISEICIFWWQSTSVWWFL